MVSILVGTKWFAHTLHIPGHQCRCSMQYRLKFDDPVRRVCDGFKLDVRASRQEIKISAAPPRTLTKQSVLLATLSIPNYSVFPLPWQSTWMDPCMVRDNWTNETCIGARAHLPMHVQNRPPTTTRSGTYWSTIYIISSIACMFIFLYLCLGGRFFFFETSRDISIYYMLKVNYGFTRK
jgi:hypothetical protein